MKKLQKTLQSLRITKYKETKDGTLEPVGGFNKYNPLSYAAIVFIWFVLVFATVLCVTEDVIKTKWFKK